MAKKSSSKCDAGTPAGTRPERPPATSLEQLLAFPLDVCEAAAGDIRPFQPTVLTGFLDLDELTGGFAESELVVVAGRPGAGASGFALNLVRKVAVEDRKSIFIVSLEQRRTDLAGRLLCCQGRLDFQKLYQGRTAGDDLQRVKEAAAALRNTRLFIEDTPRQEIGRIADTAARLKEEQGIGLVVVDSLSLIGTEGKDESRYEEVGHVARELKILAGEIRTPVVVLAGVNRSAQERPGGQPRLPDLRETGTLEEVADVVLLLHTPSSWEPGAGSREGTRDW